MGRLCRSSQDLAGNPRYKMHSFPDDGGDRTTCGLEVLPESLEEDHGYRSLCTVCFPYPHPWDEVNQGRRDSTGIAWTEVDDDPTGVAVLRPEPDPDEDSPNQGPND